MRTLLDVNGLIALLDDAHVFSRRANEWLDAEPRRIATCPIVEMGVVRILSAPAYSATHRATPGQVAEGLRAITDAYLLALAVRHGGVLASFDAAVPLTAVRGAAKRHLLAL